MCSVYFRKLDNTFRCTRKGSVDNLGQRKYSSTGLPYGYTHQMPQKDELEAKIKNKGRTSKDILISSHKYSINVNLYLYLNPM